jgi:hypothetical protein
MFNPSELTVKEARAKLGDLNLEQLQAILQAEIDDKHRSSLIAAIGGAIDDLKTAEDESPAEAVVEKPAPPQPAPEPGITQTDWYRLRRHEKGLLTICADGLYRKK